MDASFAENMSEASTVTDTVTAYNSFYKGVYPTKSESVKYFRVQKIIKEYLDIDTSAHRLKPANCWASDASTMKKGKSSFFHR